MYRILYQEEVVKKDFSALSDYWRKEIKVAIETKLTTNPDFYGKPLRRSLKNYRKLRVSDYRVIFRIERQYVKIFVIGHRSKVYLIANKRF